MPKFEYKWISPISYSSEGLAKLLREILEELDYKFQRDKVEKFYDKFYVIIPLFRFAYAFRFIITEPSEFIVDVYDTQPTHSSVMPYIEIDSVNDENIEDIQKMLTLMVEKMPREPWKFTKGQRLMHGALMPEFRKARKAWEKIGVKIK
ncbi:MAG: hypothetical protein JSV56_03120 [Methanomassiliicoccales archaeon]|nr:MAG: hypothetical protein JSV56_03120 [Methanomassiliicoccales archaeon]